MESWPEEKSLKKKINTLLDSYLLKQIIYIAPACLPSPLQDSKCQKLKEKQLYLLT